MTIGRRIAMMTWRLDGRASVDGADSDPDAEGHDADDRQQDDRADAQQAPQDGVPLATPGHDSVHRIVERVIEDRGTEGGADEADHDSVPRSATRLSRPDETIGVEPGHEARPRRPRRRRVKRRRRRPSR